MDAMHCSTWQPKVENAANVDKVPRRAIEARKRREKRRAAFRFAFFQSLAAVQLLAYCGHVLSCLGHGILQFFVCAAKFVTPILQFDRVHCIDAARIKRCEIVSKVWHVSSWPGSARNGLIAGPGSDFAVPC